jgi:glycosyltransferase involved in cell wall biosynthesis
MVEAGISEERAGEHVVFVIAGPALGGAERDALDLARMLSRRGARVSVCSLGDGPGRVRDATNELGIPWHVVPVGWHGSRASRGRALLRTAYGLRRLRPGILLSFTNRPNVLCGLTWRATGAKLMVWNQFDVLGTMRFGPKTFVRALRNAPVIVTPAEHAGEWLVREWGASSDRVHVVRDVVELAPARETRVAWRARLGLGDDDIAACMLGHLHAGKDHATLLRAWRQVVDKLDERYGRAMLLLAGRDAGKADAAKALAFDLDLRNHVRFLGDVNDVSGLLGASDVAVFSSRSECFPRGVTEPMAAGLAVVGTDVPGIREAVGAPGAELLAAVGDAGRLASAALRLVRDAELRVTIGEANARLIRARHSGETTAREYANLLAT